MLKSSGCKTAAREAASFETTASKFTINDAITPYKELAQSYTTASSLRPLIHQVLSQPKIYAGFIDLLHLPHVPKILSNSKEDTKFLNTLELFAFGNYTNYTQDKEKYLELTQAQLNKLKQLTLLSVISSHSKPYVPYDSLKQALGITSTRELEDLLMDSIYSNIMEGKLDQCSMSFVRKSVISRDIQFDYDDFVNRLKEWQRRTRHLLGVIEEKGCRNLREKRVVEQEYWSCVKSQDRSKMTSAALNSATASTSSASAMDVEMITEVIASSAAAAASEQEACSNTTRKAGKRSRGDGNDCR